MRIHPTLALVGLLAANSLINTLPFVGPTPSVPEQVIVPMDGGAEASAVAHHLSKTSPAQSHDSSANCDGPDVDPWVSEIRDGVLSRDGLVHFAVEHYGAPTTCHGAVTAEFDGARFGTLQLGFAEEVTFEVQTMPPETTVEILRAPSGFGDERLVREALRRYTADLGTAIDWSAPEITSEGTEVVHTFWDPEPGLNTSARLIFTSGTLVAVGFSMAL